MSVIKVNKIESTGTTAGGVEVDSSGHVQVDGVQLPTAGALSNRNLIINGAMQVAQRGTQYTGLTSGSYKGADRVYNSISNLGTWTIDQSTDAPAGFTKSHKMTCTTPDTSPTGLDYAIFNYIIEAQDLQHLKYGTSAAESLTLSFWVKSNKTGGASFDMWQPDSTPTGTRIISKGYTINSANTWEYKTITIPGDTAGVINDDNGPGFYLDLWLNSGPDYTGGTFQTTWGGLNHTKRNASNLGVGGAASDYFQITGLQLEVGEKPTPFEHRSYGDELARCQRYFEAFDYNNQDYWTMSAPLSAFSNQWTVVYYKQKKRAVPTFTLASGSWQNLTPTIYLGIDHAMANAAGYFYAQGTAGDLAASFDAEF